MWPSDDPVIAIRGIGRVESGRPTNNEAEMTALLRALRYELARPAAERVHVYSDSPLRALPTRTVSK